MFPGLGKNEISSYEEVYKKNLLIIEWGSSVWID